MDEDNLSSVSFVSSISATSSIHHPRPPDGPKPVVQGFHSKKSGKVVRSPYLATSTPYPNKRQKRSTSTTAVNQHTNGGHSLIGSSKSNPNVHARERWAAAVKSSGYVPAAWSSPVTPHPSASTFLQSLMKAPSFSAVVSASMAKKRKRTQSAAGVSARKSAGNVSGQMDAIALRDETVELKKALNTAVKERDLARAQLVKLEKEVGRKDREIEDLLASGHITSRDATRSLASSHKKTTVATSSLPSTHTHTNHSGSTTTSGSEAVISSLRQRIHSLERVVREKDASLTALRREVGATRVRELETQTEVYYREICRLTHLVAQLESSSSSAGGGSGRKRDSPQSVREAHTKMKALNQAMVKLSSQLERAEVEKKQLSLQLEKYRSESPSGGHSITHNEQGLRGSIADRYVDHNRNQMLSALVDMELHVKEQEGTVQSLCREVEEKKAHYERRIGELSGSQNDSLKTIQALKDKLGERESACNKMKNVVRKLKDDRSHYRALAESTQSELQNVQTKLQNEELGKSDVIRELGVLRERHQNEITAREHARKITKRKSQVFTPDRERQDSAATAIQRRWRKRKAVQRQIKFQEETDQVAVDIQSALRGHLARKKLLSDQHTSIPHSITPSHTHSITPSHSHSLTPSHTHDYTDNVSDSEDDVSESSLAVERIQAAMRGHMARQMALQDLTRTETHDSTRFEEKPSLADQWRSQNGYHRHHYPSLSSSSHTPQHLSLIGYHPPDQGVSLNRDDVINRALYSSKQHHRSTALHSQNHSLSPWTLPVSPDSTDSEGHTPTEVEVVSPHTAATREAAGVISSSTTDSEYSMNRNNPEMAFLDDELT